MDHTELIAGTARVRELIGLRHEPLAFFYSDQEPTGFTPPVRDSGCLVAVLRRARQGETVYFDAETTGCQGGTYYLGFREARPEIAHFVTTGIPGKMEGERYKASPEVFRAHVAAHPVAPAPARYAVFTPVATLQETQEPAVIICFAGPDELSGLGWLAGFARSDDVLIAPFGAGCGTIVAYPLAEAQRDLPRAVLGMFDPSARPYLAPDELSFAVPVGLWREMLGHAEESFLTRSSWGKIRQRSGH